MFGISSPKGLPDYVGTTFAISTLGGLRAMVYFEGSPHHLIVLVWEGSDLKCLQFLGEIISVWK